jgi:hypothetical protein
MWSATDSVEDLLAVEARLDRSFMVCVAALLARLAWPLALRAIEQTGAAWGGVVELGLALCLLAAYIWFAISVGGAARAVGSSATLFVLWVLASQFLALIPIPVVSLALAASPLSLKFLLSGQLRARIHAKTFEG